MLSSRGIRNIPTLNKLSGKKIYVPDIFVDTYFGKVLVGFNSFWSGPDHVGQVQIRFFMTNFYNLDGTNMIWTRPK